MINDLIEIEKFYSVFITTLFGKSSCYEFDRKKIESIFQFIEISINFVPTLQFLCCQWFPINQIKMISFNAQKIQKISIKVEI